MTQIKLSISGKMKSGKDTVADIAKKYLESGPLATLYPVHIVHVAQSVYDVTEWILGYRLIGKKIIKKTPFERKSLQIVGYWGRILFGKDIWLKQSIKKLEKMEGHILVTGVRFPNEVAQLALCGFDSVYVDCPEKLRIRRGANNMQDVTETAFDHLGKEGYVDYVIENDNDFNALTCRTLRVIHAAYNEV